MSPSRTRWAVLPLCFASGVAGLAYEVVWHRLLAVVLGNASFATAAVLAAVMGGMGIGALVVGRIADRTDPLKLYGAIELALGAAAFLVPDLAAFAGDASLPLLVAIGPGWSSFLVRFAVACTIVIVPAMLLGATLPALVRAVALRTPAAGGDLVGRSVAAVYALNTAGAAIGSTLTGYVLLGALGVRAVNEIAASIDAAVGAVALVVAFAVPVRGGSITQVSANAVSDAISEMDAPTPLPPRIVYALGFVAGFVVLGLETVWTRFFLIVFGHDVHGFTAMLVSVLLGLALGAAAYRAFPMRWRTHDALVPLLFGALGVFALGSLAFVGRRYLAGGLDVLSVESALPFVRSHERGIALQGLFALTTIVLPAAAAGAIFPALVARLGGTPAGTATGRVLAANTAGTIIGPLATALLLVPLVGIAGAAITLALAAAAAGVVLASRGGQRRQVITIGAAALIALVTLPSDLARGVLLQKIGPKHLSFELYEEGRSATVAVVANEINGERQIFVNGINEVTTRLVHDQSFMLLGHLGLLLHPDPQDVAVICLGGGLAAGAVAQHDVEHITIVDLEPAVEHAARAFSELNHGVLDDERVNLVIDDGRAHLRTTFGYDVIVLDSTHPRAVDSWLLYTTEFYELARQSLADDGVLVQWLPLHGLSVDEFRILVGTFADAFPSATLWTNAGFEPYGATAYSLLVATRDGALADPGRIAARIGAPRVHAALEPWGLASAAEVLECLHAGPETLRAWSNGLPRNTDDHPRTQFVTRYTDAAPMTPDRLLEAFAPSLELIAPAPEADLAADLAARWRAQGLLLAGDLARAAAVCGECAKMPMFEAAMAEGPAYYEALGRRYRDEPARLLEVAAGMALHGRPDRAATVLEEAAGDAEGDANILVHLGLLRAAAGDLEGAASAYVSALDESPDHVLARVNLGRVQLERGEVEAAIRDLEVAVAGDGSVADAHAALGRALAEQGRGGARPEEELRRALSIDPRHRGASITLGRLLLRQHRYEDAARDLGAALRYHPYDADLLFNLALAEDGRGDAARARAYLERLLDKDPEDTEASAVLQSLGT